jgi:hypothetical protein
MGQRGVETNARGAPRQDGGAESSKLSAAHETGYGLG